MESGAPRRRGAYAVYRFREADKRVVDSFVTLRDAKYIERLVAPALRLSDDDTIYKNGWDDFVAHYAASLDTQGRAPRPATSAPPPGLMPMVEGCCFAVHYIDGAYYLVARIEMPVKYAAQLDETENEHFTLHADAYYYTRDLCNDLITRSLNYTIAVFLAALGIHPAPDRLVGASAAAIADSNALSENIVHMVYNFRPNYADIEPESALVFPKSDLVPIVDHSPLTGVFVVKKDRVHDLNRPNVGGHNITAQRPLTHSEQEEVLSKTRFIAAQADADHGTLAPSWMFSKTVSSMGIFVGDGVQGAHVCDTLKLAIIVSRSESVRFFSEV